MHQSIDSSSPFTPRVIRAAVLSLLSTLVAAHAPPAPALAQGADLGAPELPAPPIDSADPADPADPSTPASEPAEEQDQDQDQNESVEGGSARTDAEEHDEEGSSISPLPADERLSPMEAALSGDDENDEFEEEALFAADAVVEQPGVSTTPLAGTGSRDGVPALELPATVHVLGLDDARDRGATDLESTLHLVPGVTPVFRYGGFLQLRSRGFRAIVLRDGRRDGRSTLVNSHPDGGLVDIARVEVLSGPAAVLYGYGAVGGVVNLVSREPSDVPAYSLGLRVGTPRSWEVSGSATGAVTPRIRYRLDVGHRDHENVRSAGTRRSVGALTLEYEPIDAHRVYLRTAVHRDHYDTDSGIPTVFGDDGMYELPPGARLSNRYNTPQDGLDYARYDIEAGYAFQPSDAFELRARIAYARDDYEYLSTEGLEYDDSGPSPSVDRTYYFYFFHHFRPLMGQLEFHLRGDTGPLAHRGLLVYEVDTMLRATSDRASNIFDIEIPSVDFRDPVNDAPTAPIIRDSAFVARMRSQSVFAQDHITLPGRVHLLLGARVDVFDFSTRRDQRDPDTGALTDRGVSDTRHDVGFTYRAGVVQRPVPELALFASWATGWSPNSRLGLSPSLMDGSGNVAGYASIPPEESAQLEGGVRLELGSTLNGGVTAYWIRKENVSVSRGMGVVDTAGEVRSAGLEAEIGGRHGVLSYSASYALTDARYETYVNAAGDDLAGRHPSFVARHGGSLFLTLRPLVGRPDDLGVVFGGRVTGRQFADEENRLPLEAYILLSGSIWYRVGPVRLQLIIQNVLDQRDYMVSSIDRNLTPGAGREVSLAVEWTP